MAGGTYEENIGDQPDIDIRSISTAVNDNKFIITFEVADDGTIQSSSDYYYTYTVKTSDGSTYMVQYYGGESSAIGARQDPPGSSYGTVEVSGNTITAEFDLIGDSTVTLFDAYCNHKITDQNVYTDYAPNSKNPYAGTGGTGGTDGTNGDNQKKGTPGFEAVAVIAAVGVALILIKRRK
jgi:hypothetical protein